jgi:sugar-specific transcriptional regulator TrmB
MLLPAQRSDTVKALALFGCNARESAIYLKLLELGPTSVQELARALKQNRITVHSAVEQLVAKGFLYESRRGKRRIIGAEEPVVLSNIVTRKESDLTILKDNVGALIRLLSAVRRPESSAPTVKFYEGKDGFKRMLEETLEARDGVLVITYVDLFAHWLTPAYLEDYFKRRSAKGIHTKLIYPPSKFGERVKGKARDYKIEIRTLPPELEWRAGVFSWNDSIGIQSLTENRLTCTIIENKDIAHFWRAVVYPLLWRSSKPL